MRDDCDPRSVVLLTEAKKLKGYLEAFFRRRPGGPNWDVNEPLLQPGNFPDQDRASVQIDSDDVRICVTLDHFEYHIYFVCDGPGDLEHRRWDFRVGIDDTVAIASRTQHLWSVFVSLMK
jgi:hypothetical protein